MVKTVFFSFLNEQKNVAFLIDCSEGSVNKFPFIRRQLKEEIVQREDNGLNLFAINIAKYGSNNVECWSKEPRFASVGNIVQATHWINDRVGLSSFGSPKLIPAINQIIQSDPTTSPVDCITIITDHQPSECLGDLILSLEVRGQIVPLNVVYLYHLSKDGDSLDFYRTLCTKTGGDLKTVELSCEGDLVSCEVIVQKTKVSAVHPFIPGCQPCYTSAKETIQCVPAQIASCMSGPVIYERVQTAPVVEKRSGLEKNAIVLARRNDVEGYFYLAKILDSTLVHEKLVEFLETHRPEITKCSDYDMINIREAMSYSVFPGSRVLGKIDTQRFCPGTVLHGSLEGTQDDRVRKIQDNLVVEYCNGEISSTAPSRLVRIPESLFYWLQKIFPECAKSEPGVRRDLDINAATAKLTLRDDSESALQAKLAKFFRDGDDKDATSWHRHMYSHLPHYDFDRNKYENDKHLIKWYQERYRARQPKEILDWPDSEPDEALDSIQFTRKPKTLQLKPTLHDQYLALRKAENEQEWYKKLLKRENEILRRSISRRPKSALNPPPAPWRHWFKQGQEPAPEFQKPSKSDYFSGQDDRNTSSMGLHVMPTNKHDSLFSHTPDNARGNRGVSVKRLLIQTDPKNPPGSRDQTEAIYTKRW